MSAEFKIIKTEFAAGLITNTILVSNGQGDFAIVDPNGKFDLKVRPRAVYLTHGHYDHVSAANDFDAPVYMSDLDIPVVKNFSNQILEMAGFAPMQATQNLPGEEIEFLPNLPAKLIKTPGHTPGGICFYFERQRVLLTGDFIFAGGYIGRTDMPYGDHNEMIKSLEKFRALNLPRGVLVIPGHGETFNL